MDRVGIGQDSHRFAKLREPLILGGVKMSARGGLEGNSDSDVILHSLCNALSSALGGDSLGTWADAMFQGGILDSQKYVEVIFKKIKAKKFKVKNVSISVEAKKPFIQLEVSGKMKKTIANLLEIKKEQVGITFTSGEGLTAFGKELGIQSTCIVLLSHV